MKSCYINGIGAVSTQTNQEPLQPITAGITKAQHPSYKELIAPAMIRRMASGVKMGIFAAYQALEQAQVALPDAIVTGTGMGCLQDSEKFLRALLEHDEQFLTPTSFIQSTHNTVGAQIALQLQCKGYNFTYVNGGNSFESALLDALIQIQTQEASTVLVGGVDELSEVTLQFLQLVDRVKKEDQTYSFQAPQTKGVPFSEGSTFFVVSSEKQTNTYAELVDVWVQNRLHHNSMAHFVKDFLERNQLTIEAIDAIVVGYNADQNQMTTFDAFAALFPHTSTCYYKHLSGEYDTASAYGLKIGAELLKNQALAPIYYWKNAPISSAEYVLLFNAFYNEDYSLVLLKKC